MVYIGKNEYRYGRMIMSHVGADTVAELTTLCALLKIDSKHLQKKRGRVHLDICKSKKQEALGWGFPSIKLVNDREIVKMLKTQTDY